MNKRNWISALLAVMMVISMMACIVVPVAAEEYTLPEDAVHIDDITALNTEGRNIYIESAKDLVTLATKHAGKLLHLTDVVYLKNDIDVATYKGADGTNTFSTDYTAMTWGKSGVFSIDGLGHVISNWNDTQGIFAEYKFEKTKDGGDVYIKNLTMLNALIDNSSAPTNAGVLLDKIGAEGASTSDKKVGSITIENVHIIGCHTITNGHYAGALIGRETVKNTTDIDVIIKDCSIVGNVFEDANDGTRYGAGIVIGRADANVSSTLIENCVVSGNTILGGAGTYKDSGGMLVGDAQHPITFKNVSVVNNTKDMDSGSGYAGILTHNISSAATIVADGIFAAGNVSLIADVAETTVSLVNTKSSASDVGSATVSNYKTDSNVALAVDAYDDTKDVANAGVTAGYSAIGAIIDQNASVLYTDWGFKANAAGDGVDIVLLKDGEKAPVKVTFTADGNTDTYYTDVNGNLRVTADENGMPVLADAADITALGTSDWKAANGEAVNAGADWTTMVVDEDVAYTKASLPPYTMTLDKDTYVKGDIVTATVSLIAGSNLQGIEVGFNYDENVLTPVADAEGNYAIAANGWLVTDKAESEHMMAAIASALSGENATEAVDVFSVKFKVTQDLASTASELAVTAVLEYAGGLVGDVMTELDLEAYTTVEIVGAAEIKNNELIDYSHITTPASKAYWGDGISEYYIDSVGELIKTNMAIHQARDGAAGEVLSGDGDYTVGNFEPDDVIYLTADLDMANWDYEEFATYEEGVGYIPSKIVSLEFLDDYNDDAKDSIKSSLHYVYVDNDLEVVYDNLQDLFSAMYSGFAIGYRSTHGNMAPRFTFDGLGHTIKNYKSNYAFFNGNFVGIIKNVTFDNAYVTAKAEQFGSSSTYVNGIAILAKGSSCRNQTAWDKTEDSFTVENVHINNSTLDIGDQAVTEAGIFLGTHNNNGGNDESVSIKNCSAINTHIVANSDTAAKSYGIIAGRNTAPSVIDNIILKDCSITTKSSSYHSLLIGFGSGSSQGWTVSNIAIVDCKVVASTATADNVAIMSSCSSCTHANTFKNFYISGNTFATETGGDETPATNLLVFPGAVKNYSKVPTMSNIVADANVVNAIYWTADTTKNKAVNANTLGDGLLAAVTELEKTITEAHWRVNADGSLYLLGQEVTFKSKGEEDMVRYTSRLNEHILYEETENGFVAVDPALFTKLTNNYWYDAKISKPAFEDFIEVGYDWENETYAEDITYVRVPNASEATKYDGYTVYVIPTVDELIAASNSETYNANKVTFPSKEDSFGGTNARAHGGFVEKTSVRGDFSTYNTIYITNDLDIPSWEAETGRDFSDEYDGWILPDSVSNYNYTTAVFVLDGLNHTIKGYDDNRSFFAATFNGVLQNITFVDGTVTATETLTTTFLNNAVEKGGTVYDNVHLKGCDLTTMEATANYVGLFSALASNNVRPATYKNCSIDTCSITAPGTVSQIGLFQGGHRTSAVFTMENCYAVDSTITVGKLGETQGHGLLLGNVYNTTAQSLKINNVAAVNCNFKTLDAEAANVDKIAVVTRVDKVAAEGSDIGTIISYGNTKTYTSNEEEVTEPIDYLFRDTLGTFTAQDAVVDGEFIVDSTVKAAINNESDTENVVTAGSLTVDDTLVDLASVIAVMNSAEATADWYLDNGNYVPAAAMNGTVGERLNVGHNDIADVINNAKSGDTVKVCLDQEASTVAIPAGVTVELNGAVLDAIVGGDGYVNDNTDGKGGVTGLGTIGAANAQLPLNDKANGVYRLYNVSVVAGTDSAIDGYDNARKFRVKLNFTNKDAYTLVAAGTSGLTLQAVLASSALDADVTYTFKNVVAYAQAIVDNPTKSYSLVLNVYGVDAVADTDLNITYNAASYGAVKSGATTYAVPAVEA